jgi:hypothetical protein
MDLLFKCLEYQDQEVLISTIKDRELLKFFNFIDDDDRIQQTWDAFSKDINMGFYPILSLRYINDDRYVIKIEFNSNNFKTELSFNRSKDVVISLLEALNNNLFV